MLKIVGNNHPYTILYYVSNLQILNLGITGNDRYFLRKFFGHYDVKTNCILFKHIIK